MQRRGDRGRDPRISPEVALVAAQAARRAELRGQFTAGLVGLALIGILCSGPTLAGSAAGLLAAMAGSLAGGLLVGSAVRSRLRRRERPLGRLTNGATGRADDASAREPTGPRRTGGDSWVDEWSDR